jgi:hypothetical protein
MINFRTARVATTTAILIMLASSAAVQAMARPIDPDRPVASRKLVFPNTVRNSPGPRLIRWNPSRPRVDLRCLVVQCGDEDRFHLSDDRRSAGARGLLSVMIFPALAVSRLPKRVETAGEGCVAIHSEAI